jgi:signal transduction histidine kinase
MVSAMGSAKNSTVIAGAMVPPMPFLTRTAALDAVLAGALGIVAEVEILSGQVPGPRPSAAAPARAREPLRSVQDTGRQALVELRRLLGVLRTDDSEAALAPRPGLDQVGALAAHVREAGVAVDVRVDGERDDIPARVDLAAYRIVQEALTNVLKHAGASHAAVRVGYRPDVIELEILDDGRGALANGHRTNPTGHGLIGMRERASLYGGVVEARPRPEGGFAVCARLPVRSPA